jgi:sugar lactone lactonase YvrE
MSKIELISDKLIFGESLRWKNNRLWASDIYGHRVVNIGRDGDLSEVIRIDGYPGGLGWLPDGRLLMVSSMDFAVLVLDDGKLTTYCDLRSICSGPPNDMIVDAHGRAYVGNLGTRRRGAGRFDPTNLVMVVDGKAEVVAEDISFPNGSVISADGRTMILAESDAHRLTAFDIDETGHLSNRRLYADLGDRIPDGCAMDAGGGVWVGCFDRGEFIRVGANGQIVDRIEIGARRAVCCVVAGSDLLMTSLAAMSESDIHAGKSRSFVEAISLTGRDGPVV